MSENQTNTSKQEDLDFETLMKQRLQENFGISENDGLDFSPQKLSEMKKRLPAWDLEPPTTFLK